MINFTVILDLIYDRIAKNKLFFSTLTHSIIRLHILFRIFGSELLKQSKFFIFSNTINIKSGERVTATFKVSVLVKIVTIE